MITREHIFEILETVLDPEVPVLSVVDLGIIRKVEILNEHVKIQITPTYTGCPAMKLIEMNLQAAFDAEKISVSIETILSPAWTTDWMSANGKQKLIEYGIAAPVGFSGRIPALFEKEIVVACPRCQSEHTEKISEFGSTACKALYRCLNCKEPFDYFKCH